MERIAEFFGKQWEFIMAQAGGIRVLDVVDIVLVTLLFYYVFKFIRDRRAGKLLIGVLLLIVFQAVSAALGLVTINYILQNVYQVGIIALIILFQPELRSMLEKVGVDSLRSIKNIAEQKDVTELQNMVSAVCDAVEIMSQEKTGALIVLEREVKLGDYIQPKGTVVDSAPSSYLIRNIFFNKSPLHDGALIIRPPRLYAAGCVLPLSTKSGIIETLGTRHRAAIGVSENSDAIAVVVSEETGTISVAYNGKLYRGLSRENLEHTLTNAFVDNLIKKKDSGKTEETEEKKKKKRGKKEKKPSENA